MRWIRGWPQGVAGVVKAGNTLTPYSHHLGEIASEYRAIRETICRLCSGSGRSLDSFPMNPASNGFSVNHRFDFVADQCRTIAHWLGVLLQNGGFSTVRYGGDFMGLAPVVPAISESDGIAIIVLKNYLIAGLQALFFGFRLKIDIAEKENTERDGI